MRKLAFVIGSLLLMVAMPAPASAAEPTVVVRADVSGQYENQCTGESILTTGTSTLIYKSSLGEESYPVFERAIFQGTAVGETSGIEYRVVISAMDPGTTVFTPGGAVAVTDVLIYRFIAPGGTEDLYLRIAHHNTFSATGVLTADPVIVDAQCFT